ncbi:hypothetical protein MRX96_023916 [Rhipicephalus microplus]
MAVMYAAAVDTPRTYYGTLCAREARFGPSLNATKLPSKPLSDETQARCSQIEDALCRRLPRQPSNLPRKPCQKRPVSQIQRDVKGVVSPERIHPKLQAKLWDFLPFVDRLVTTIASASTKQAALHFFFILRQLWKLVQLKQASKSFAFFLYWQSKTAGKISHRTAQSAISRPYGAAQWNDRLPAST